MADSQRFRPPNTPRRLSWTRMNRPSPLASEFSLPSTHTPAGSAGLPYARSPPQASSDHLPSARSSTASLSKGQLDQKASQIIRNALERTTSQQSGADSTSPYSNHGRSSGSFGRMSFSSMMGGLSALSLSRGSTNDDNKERGRSNKRSRSASRPESQSRDDNDDRTRSMSPFRRRRNSSRARDPSPSVEALQQSDVESDSEALTPGRSIRPRNAFSSISDDESAGESEAENDSDSEESWSEDEEQDQLDAVTSENTSRNALSPSENLEPDGVEAPDPLGEGVNIIVPPEPYFPTTLNAPSASRNARRRKSLKTHEALSFSTSTPSFQRDRCTITLVQGHPERALEESGRRKRRYVVGSDLSDESRYAVEWGIGTVLRDGDELYLVSVREDESKVDPPASNPTDRVSKIRNQQERSALAYILIRQVTSLLQRTKLQVTVICQAWHARNSRHMLLDIIDHVQPSMLIVGSRGLGQLKGILLGSTSHYLIQKCSVPVMVARRRLKRPPRRSAHLSKHHARVSLAEAARIERVTPRVDQAVESMRDEMEEEEVQREHAHDEDVDVDVDGDGDGDEDDLEGSSSLGRKVRGD